MSVVTLYPAFRPVMFLTELASMSFRIDDAKSSSVQFAVLDSSGNAVFTNSYVTAADGSFAVYDIDKLVRPLLSGLLTKFSFRVAGHILTGGEVSVVDVSVRVSGDAETFLRSCFLTAVQADSRVTARGRIEMLYAYIMDGEPGELYVTARLYDAAAGTVLERDLVAASLPSGYAEIDISPDHVAHLMDIGAAQLLSYTVTLGRRKVTYTLNGASSQSQTCLMFLNCFGQPERIYLSGTSTVSPSYERSQALVNGALLTFDVNETMKHVVHTGPMPRSMEPLLLDLLRSRTVVVVRHEATQRNAEDMEEVAVTQCDPKLSSDLTVMNDVEITYRPVAAVTAMLVPRRTERTFDNTFDQTFD